MPPRLALLRRAALALSLLAAALAASCGGGDDSADNDSPGGLKSGKSGSGGKGGGAAGAAAGGGGDAGGSAGSGVSLGGQGGSGGSGGSAAGAATCSPACVAPQVCGKSGACIAPGSCAASADCDGGKVCDAATKTCVPGSECGAAKLVANVVPPNLLLVQDRSCTMNGLIGSKSKWELAVGAVTSVVKSFKGKIRFGLTLFPDHDEPNCTQAKYLLPPKAGNENAIISLMTAGLDASDTSHPGSPCVTNGAQTMTQASTEPALDDKARKSYFVLITDGLTQQVCDLTGADGDTATILGALFTKRGIPTYVIGFGSGQIDKDELNNFALAGGVPTTDPGDPSIRYHRAESGDALVTALQGIAQKSLGCDYQLDTAPPDENSLYVFFNQTTQVAKDPKHQDGWDYDPATKRVTFYGPTCQSLQQGSIASVDIVFGCPGNGGTTGVPPSCQSGIGCDALHVCPNDPQKGLGFCADGCCKFNKIE